MRDLTLVDKIPQNRRLRIGLDIDVRGLGPWSGEVPTLVLDEEALRKTRTRVASANQLFQPTVDRGVVELQPVASVPSELLQVLQKTKR